MTPTTKLRFVRRQVPINSTDTKTVNILQQWWAPFRIFSDGYGYQTVEQKGGEWRDVPMEDEA